MAKRSSRRRSKKRRPGFSKQYKHWLLILAASAALVLCLVVLSERVETPVDRQLPPTPTEQSSARIEARARTEVEAFLATLELDSRAIERDLASRPLQYRVKGDFPSLALLDSLSTRLKSTSRSISITPDPNNRRLSMTIAGREHLVVEFLAKQEPQAVSEPRGPRVAVIMDDLGRGLFAAQVLLSLDEPVTFAVLPGESHAAQVARLAHEGGREVMLHVPMEPQGYPAVNPGDDALMVRYDDREIQTRFSKFLEIIPFVSGANNHMGSRFTENARAMAAVMEIVAQKHLFFVDSLTTGRSQVSEVASQFRVPHIDRDVFLDNVADVDEIRKQTRKLIARAKQQGYAVGICHPYPETLEALRQELPTFAAQGVEVVPVSALLRAVRD